MTDAAFPDDLPPWLREELFRDLTLFGSCCFFRSLDGSYSRVKMVDTVGERVVLAESSKVPE